VHEILNTSQLVINWYT